MWDKSVHLIKDHITSINNRLEMTGRDGEGTLADYRPWINRCYQFITTFGKHAVPSDIQSALNSVEEGLGLPLTEWPDPSLSYDIN